MLQLFCLTKIDFQWPYSANLSNLVAIALLMMQHPYGGWDLFLTFMKGRDGFYCIIFLFLCLCSLHVPNWMKILITGNYLSAFRKLVSCVVWFGFKFSIRPFPISLLWCSSKSRQSKDSSILSTQKSWKYSRTLSCDAWNNSCCPSRW